MNLPEMSTEDVQRFKVLLEHFKQMAEDGINPAIEQPLINLLDTTIPFFSNLVLTDTFPELHRLTINKRVLGSNKRIREIKYLKYPPKEYVKKYGRCNLKNQSVLYASYMTFTVMNEVKPRKGDLVTESIWRVKGDQELMFCPLFKNQPMEEDVVNMRSRNLNKIFQEKLKEYPDYAREVIDSFVQFVTGAFTKRANPDNDLDYLFSAYFSNKIFNEFEEGKIEAIHYPSVQNNLSLENIAVKPDVFDKKYDLIEVRESVCDMDTTSGVKAYMFHGLSECKKFDLASGKILWDNKISQSAETIADLKARYEIDLE